MQGAYGLNEFLIAIKNSNNSNNNNNNNNNNNYYYYSKNKIFQAKLLFTS